MYKTRNIIIVICTLLSALWVIPAHAAEGMWIPLFLKKLNETEMKSLGMKISAEDIYSANRSGIKDAVVLFGGGCTGEVVSPEGLLLTNHHCGYSVIAEHSTIENNILENGFFARDKSEELVNPSLSVTFIKRIEEVTDEALKGVSGKMTPAERKSKIESNLEKIRKRARIEPWQNIEIKPFFKDNRYFMFIRETYTDVRLVGCPPVSVGKFGSETDNWVWPRHTGDFSVFRIYAGKDNRPADYSPDNVPYHPEYVAPISLDGYREGSFCMTMGYPGSTERYLSSFGIEEMMTTTNQAQIDVRGVKQAIWKREMDSRDSIRIKYASKYDESSNYWKNSIGVNRTIKKLHVLDKKRAMETELRRWIQQTPEEREHLLHLFSDLELNYKSRRDAYRARAYFAESFLNGPELVQLALSILNFDFEGEEKTVVANLKAIVEKYANLDLGIDKEVFTALLKEYRSQVDSTYLPELYQTIATEYGGNERTYVDSLYARSELTTPRGLKRFLEQDTTYQIYNDPAINLGIDLITKLFEMNMQVQQASGEIERNERLFNSAVRRMYASRNFYPDANSTMRLSFGTVCGYAPFDGAEYDYYTTAKGILEKVRAHAGDVDFEVQPELLSLLSSGDFGRYADEKGEMNVCFISNNDITGGNSGSAMFNAKGELLGLAFDGNWEAMSSDILYEPKMQRTIGVDVRYILFMIEKYGKAGNLIQELKLANP